MVATEKPMWEPPFVFRTSFIFLFKARAKSFKLGCLKYKLPQALIWVIQQMAGFYRACEALTDVGREWQGLLGWLLHCLPNQHPNRFPDFFKLRLGQITFLQPPSLITAFLIPDPTAQPESSATALCILSELSAHAYSSHRFVSSKSKQGTSIQNCPRRGNCHSKRYH